MANATCYFPDGQIDTFGKACNPSASESHCCNPTFLCLSNSLCWDVGNNHIIRGSCTDASWLSGDCPQYCKDDTSTVFGDMRECPGQVGVWTCGLDPSNCTNSFSIPSGYLDDNRDTTLSAIVALPAPYTSSSLGTDPATVTKTVLATVTASTSAMSSPYFKNDNATTIGLGTGLGVGLPLLLALCVSLWFLHRAQKRIKVLGTGNNSPRIEIQNQGDSTKWPLSHEIDGRYVYEVPAVKS